MDDPRYSLATHIEIAAWLDLYRAAPDSLVRNYDLGIDDSPGTPMVYVPGIAHPMLNRAWLLSADPQSLARIRDRFRALGVNRYMVHVQRSREPAELGELVRYRRRWVKLAGRVDPDAAPVSPSRVPIAEADAADAADCGNLYCAGFDIDPAVSPLFAGAVGRPGWRVFIARDPSGEPAGVGYLYAHRRVAYLAGGVTAKRYRRRGIQGGMLAARVSAAAARGCDWIASETGERTAGDPQHSQRNMERYGLEVVGLTTNLVPRGPIWNHGAARPPSAQV